MTTYWNYIKFMQWRIQQKKADRALPCCFRTISPAFMPLISTTLLFLFPPKRPKIIYIENCFCIDSPVVL